MNRDLSMVAPAPRQVRWDVKVQLLLWPLRWLAVVLLLLAPLAAVVIVSPYRTLRLALSSTATAPAKVFITKSYSGKSRLPSFHYQFSVNGQTHGGGGQGPPPSQGTAVYVVSQPSINKLVGYSSGGMSSLPIVLLSLLAAIPATWFFGRRSVQAQLRRLETLVGGQCAQAEIIELNPVKTDIGKTWYKMRYSITTPGASEPTFLQIDSDKPNGLGDEQKEDVVYDPLDPENAVFLDALPGVVLWDPKSGWISSSPHITLAILLMPLPGLWVFWKFLTLLL